ncbi:hypothetical protein RRG08_005119, partial [Elysia crispata]
MTGPNVFYLYTRLTGSGIFDPCYFWSGSVYVGDGKCFKFLDQLNTFGRSQEACEAEGATLAETRTPQQIDAARTLSSDIGPVWLGGWDPDGGSNLVWLSDQQNVSLQVTIKSNKGKTAICLAMNSATELTTKSCGRSLSFICQIAGAGNPCDVYLPGGEYYDSNCFLPVVEHMTLEDATLNCEKREAKVAEPSTERFVSHMTQVANWNFEPASDIWLGLTQLDSVFKWQSTGESVTAGNWVNGDIQPLVFSSESAVVMNGSFSWAWQVVSKSHAAGFVCQRNLTEECIGVFSSGRCFTIHHNVTDWDAAKAACEDSGSYLAEPKTEVLARTVAKYVNDTADAVYVFLGASDSETEGSLVWNHSRELLNNTYTAWNPGQPEYHNDSDQFLQYSSGGWNVISSNLSKSHNNSFLCEQ